MLIASIIIYLLLNIAVGLYAARRVKSSTDYVVAGRSLPLYMTIATVFATWFGSETVLGVSATFLDGGLAAIIADPFGAAMCLILVGLVFARPLYRMRLLTIGDYYRQRYGRKVELFISVAICASYLGWVSAQIMALGLVFELVTGGAVSLTTGMVIGTIVVLLYTIYGGMWSVAMTDFIQMIVIVVGLVIIAVDISSIVGGPMAVISHAAENDKFVVMPEWSLPAIFAFIGAWITMGFGSIPQQDVFQRVMSAKTEDTAVKGAVIGGVLYLLFAFIPIFLAYSAHLIDPAVVSILMDKDSQHILPTLIMDHTPMFIQVMFFGALLSAIMSTASGTLLAPSVVLTENILKPILPQLTDKQFLRLTRVTVALFAGVVLNLAINSNLTIFEMVENAYKVTLAGAIVPLFAGIYWKRANTLGAYFSIFMGVGTWLTCEVFVNPETELMPAQLAGFIASVAGIFIGTYLQKPFEKHLNTQIERGSTPNA